MDRRTRKHKISGKKIKKAEARNLNRALNIWAVSVLMYSGPFLGWAREKFNCS